MSDEQLSEIFKQRFLGCRGFGRTALISRLVLDGYEPELNNLDNSEEPESPHWRQELSLPAMRTER